MSEVRSVTEGLKSKEWEYRQKDLNPSRALAINTTDKVNRFYVNKSIQTMTRPIIELFGSISVSSQIHLFKIFNQIVKITMPILGTLSAGQHNHNVFE